jgi:Ser/Thr protein kinase RdoA (MazF antagonist)
VSEFFFRLTPDQVLAAVEAGGFRPTGHCSALNSLENRVYDVRLEDDTHVVAKFYRPERWSRAAILEEHAFLGDLGEAEIPVCAPLAFADGETLHRVQDIWYAVWPRTGGRAPDELADTRLQVLGRLLARIHNVGALRDAPSRRRLSANSFVHEPLEILGDHLPPSCAHRYAAAAQRVAALYEERAPEVPVHRIHGDCHVGNLLDGREGLFFLDFDDFVIGPAVQDVWMLAPGRDAEGLRQRRVLIDAYRQFRDFDERWLRLAEPLRAMRFVHYAAWIARRWQDPAFPPTFPHFGTEDYWEGETRDLEEQVERIQREDEPEGPHASGGDAPELSNRDFFWDL